MMCNSPEWIGWFQLRTITNNIGPSCRIFLVDECTDQYDVFSYGSWKEALLPLDTLPYPKAGRDSE
jgi:hypothetical protein